MSRESSLEIKKQPGDLLPSITENPDNQLDLLLLAFYYGAYVLFCVILFHLPGSITGNEEFTIFVQGWIATPLLVLFAAVGIYKTNRAWFSNVEGFFSILLASATLFGLLSALGLFIWQSGGVFSVPIGVAVLFPLSQALTLWGGYKYRDQAAFLSANAFIKRVYWLPPIGVWMILLLFSGIAATYEGYALPIQSVLLAVPFGFLSYFHKYLLRSPVGKTGLTIDIIAILLILGGCFNPYFPAGPLHQNFYLGPINALLHGKTMLVDVYSQYGVFLHEFLALFFALKIFPLNYQGLTLLVTLFCMAQYALIYYLLRILLKSPLFSLIALSIILLLNFFAIRGYFPSFPSIGPIRFGLCYVLIVFVALRLKYPVQGKFFLLMEYSTLGIASVWSFEAFIYVAAIFMGLRGYQMLAESDSIGGGLKWIVAESFYAAAAIGLAHLVQALAIFIQAGSLPNWGYYLGYIYIYSVAGFGGLPIDAWSPWFIVVMIYFLGLIAPFTKWVITGKFDTSLETQIIVSLAFFGIAQFTYYVGRSHPEALLHVCVPAIIIAAYGIRQLTQLQGEVYAGAKHASMFAAYASIALLVIAFAPHLIPKIPETGFGFLYTSLERRIVEKTPFEKIALETYRRLWNSKPSTPEANTAISLIQKYAAAQPRVLIFLPNRNGSRATTEALFLSNKAHLLPVTDQLQDAVSPQVSSFIINFKPDLHAGDVVFLPSNPKELMVASSLDVELRDISEYQKAVVLKLCGKFNLVEIKRTESGVSVFRLDLPESGTSNYCAQVKELPN
jgi:hypothetical protein